MIKGLRRSFKLYDTSMQSSRVPKSSSTVSATGTSVTVSRVSHPELAARQRQQGSFIGLSTTIHKPETALTPTTYHQQDEQGLLSETSTTQINPFEAPATCTTVTFGDDHQGQSASSLSLSSEPSRSQKSSQTVDDVPIVREEQSPDSTDKWIMMIGDNKKQSFKCGFESCGRKYSKKEHLRAHLVTHIGDSKLRCRLGECAGKAIYPNTRALARHIHVHHTFERPFKCELCHERFRRADHLKTHIERMHYIKSKKKSPKRHSDFIKSSSAATATITASTSTMTSRFSQPELAAEQRQQGSFADLSKTVHTPEPTLTPATYYQQDVLGLLYDISVSDISSLQVDPFEILATHPTVTFEDQDQFQEQLDEFPLPFDELLQPVDDFDLMASEDPDDVNVNLSILPNKNDERIRIKTTISIPKHEILPPDNDYFRQASTGIMPRGVRVGITGDLKLSSSQHQKYQRPEIDKWIILTGDKEKPFKCGYEGCDRSYTRKSNLRAHFVKHTGDSPYKCYMGECAGKVAFCKRHELIRHIRREHVLERPYHCDVCHKRFLRSDHLLNHKRKVHSIENEKKSPKRKKK